MFLYKNLFLLIFSFLSITIELWESTAAIFRQSAGHVFKGSYQKHIIVENHFKELQYKFSSTYIESHFDFKV